MPIPAYSYSSASVIFVTSTIFVSTSVDDMPPYNIYWSSAFSMFSSSFGLKTVTRSVPSDQQVAFSYCLSIPTITNAVAEANPIGHIVFRYDFLTKDSFYDQPSKSLIYQFVHINNKIKNLFGKIKVSRNSRTDGITRIFPKRFSNPYFRLATA